MRIALIIISLLGISCFAKAFTTENIKVSDQEKIDSRYCIVVGSFSSLEKAKIYGKMAQGKGYEVSYRDNGKGFYRVCVFDFKSGAEAQKRIDELKTKEDIFKQCWVLKYDADAAPVKHEASVRFAEKPRTSVAAPSVADTKKKEPEEKPNKTSFSAPTINPEVSKEKPKETTVAAPTVNTKATEQKQKEANITAPATDTKTSEKKVEKQYAHYCLVVGSFPASNEAKSFGESVQTNGYGVFFRKDEKGSVLVCMYDLKTKPDAEKRIDKMRHIDGIFIKAWILGYDSITDNLRIDQL